MRVAVLGGGAAGFFSAVCISENFPNAQIVLFEKTQKLLSKVKISGGGRCNVTTSCKELSELIAAYPRGGKQLKFAFHEFNNQHTIEWFEKRGVDLYSQSDGRMFPVSDSSQTIMDCLLNIARRNGVQIRKGIHITRIKPSDKVWDLSAGDEEIGSFEKVIVATGGSPKREGIEWLEELNHGIVEPVPSLFTFNIPNDSIVDLSGISCSEVLAEVKGTKLKSNGPILVTHWGLSGPCILKMSSIGARILNDLDYNFTVRINWIAERNESIVREKLEGLAKENGRKKITNGRLEVIPERLWAFLLERAQLNADRVWGEIGSKGINKLVSILCNDQYQVEGKTTFKEEFVTAGGIDLKDVNMKTMESKHSPGLYFCGEVLNIDGITGGYNFQAAWTTAYIASQLN